MTAAINIKDVHKLYGTLHALKGISLTIEKGEFFALLGPNGAGKSTLINILAGLTRASSGDAWVAGHHVRRDAAQARRSLGVVPQEIVFDPFFTVREVLRIQAGYYGLGRQAHPWIEHLLDALQLADKANANMRTLSGGMKRRVLVAQALVHRPPVIVLDEPTAGVDVELRQLLWSFIRSLHRDGHTIVLTTHYLEEAEQLCNRVAILQQGRLIALDSTADLLAKEGGHTRELHVTLAAPLTALPESLVSLVTRAADRNLVFPLPAGGPSVSAILDGLRAAGGNVIDLHTEERDLEDIFVTLTRRASS